MVRQVILVVMAALCATAFAVRAHGDRVVAGSVRTDGPGLRVTFQSCGYNAPFLSVTCTNGNTGGSGAEILRVDDVTPHACAMRLATACGTAGYRTSVNGDSVDIFGTGIRVDTAGPTFTTETF